MNALVVALLLVASATTLPLATADPTCAGPGPIAACVDPESLALLDPPFACPQVQDAPCPDPDV